MGENRGPSNSAGPLVRIALAEQVYKVLRERITWNEIPSGTRLLETRLAEEFGISRTPVRQALHTLEAEGLIARQSWGLAVSPFDLEVAVETMILHELLEPFAAAQSAPNLEEHDLVRLRSILFEMKAFLDSDVRSPKRETQLNKEFHILLNSKCPYQRVLEIIKSASDNPWSLRFHSTHSREYSLRVYEEHVKIVDTATAIARTGGDPECIERLIFEHMRAGRIALMSSLSSLPDDGTT